MARFRIWNDISGAELGTVDARNVADALKELSRDKSYQLYIHPERRVYAVPPIEGFATGFRIEEIWHDLECGMTLAVQNLEPLMQGMWLMRLRNYRETKAINYI